MKKTIQILTRVLSIVAILAFLPAAQATAAETQKNGSR